MNLAADSVLGATTGHKSLNFCGLLLVVYLPQSDCVSAAVHTVLFLKIRYRSVKSEFLPEDLLPRVKRALLFLRRLVGRVCT